MRILMLAQGYPPVIGGAEQYVRHLSLELARRGHSIAVVTLAAQSTPGYALDDGVRIYTIGGTLQRIPWLFSTARRHAPPFPDPESVSSLRHVIAHEGPDIVHAHDWLVHTFLPLKAWSRARLVMTLHDYSLVCAQKRLMYKDRRSCPGPAVSTCPGCAAHHYGLAKGMLTVLGNWTMGIAERHAVDMFLPVSEAVANGSGLTAARLPFQVIPNFIPDATHAQEEGTEVYLSVLPGDGFLLFVGDLVHDKGVSVLLEAYASLPAAPPLVLIGRRSSELPRILPPRVIVLHNWPHGAITQAWRRSVLALVPSVWQDPCPTVALEAMAAGRPVIASRIGGLTDIVVDGQTGYLVPPHDVSALREAIAHLLADQALRERMGDAARHRALAFSASRVVPRIEQVYRQVLHRQDAPALRRYETSSA